MIHVTPVFKSREMVSESIGNRQNTVFAGVVGPSHSLRLDELVVFGRDTLMLIHYRTVFRGSSMIAFRWWSSFAFLAILLIGISAATTTNGDFTIIVGNGQGTANPTFTAVQGTSGVVLPVFGYVTSGAPDLDGFNIAFDFAGDDPLNDPNAVEANEFGVPTGFDITNLTAVDGGSPLDGSVNANNAIATALNSAFSGNVKFDFIVNRNSSSTTISTDSNFPTKLFDLVFDIGDNAVPGKYTVNLLTSTASGPVPELTTLDPAGLGNLIAIQGAFQVTAVPEPTPLFGAVALATYGAFQRRRRKKRRVVHESVETTATA